MEAIPAYPHDLFTDAVLAEPHEHFRALRELGPVVWLEAHEMYAIPRYEEARAALIDSETFCSGKGVALNEVMNGIGAGRSTLMTDGEVHEHLRSVLARNITPRALSSLNDQVVVLAADLVRQLVDQGTFDAVADLARALPLKVVPDLVGWPTEGRDLLLEWAGATFELFGPMNERASRAMPLAQAMYAFADETAANGNLRPGSVGAGVIDAARRGDLEPDRVSPLLVGYLVPSLDTTISAIGSAMWLLATHPDQWDVLKADPSMVPNAFNETLRLESPIRAFSRVTTTETRVGAFDIPADARVVIFYAAANRDERRFARPDEFDITRSNAGLHLGFGLGAHSCAGQGLARMEAHAVLLAIVDQVESLELHGEPTRALNNVINAWASLPLTVRSPSG